MREGEHENTGSGYWGVEKTNCMGESSEQSWYLNRVLARKRKNQVSRDTPTPYCLIIFS